MSGAQFKPQFRAIVVGGGPVGLIAAQILSKAGLDFVVLERGSTTYPDLGASLILYPMTFRIFDQLGILDEVDKISTGLKHSFVNTFEGDNVKDTEFKSEMLYGHETGVFHRAQLLKSFYDTLSEEAKTRVLTNKKVIDIDVTDQGVSATCADGTTYHGSIIIAADGVNSTVRDRIRKLTLSEAPDARVNEENPYLATYKVMFGNAPVLDPLQPGEVHESHGKDQSTQVFVGKERMWFFVYRKLAEATRERISYSAEDTEKYAEQMGDLPVAKNLTVRDIFSKKNGAGLTNVGEGIVREWSWKRVVFIGDAVHKVAPNFGWGLNSGIQDAVVLANHLRKALRTTEDGAIDAAGLAKAFRDYQEERAEHISTIVATSANVIRSATWATPFYHIMDQYIIPISEVDQVIGQKLLSPLIAGIAVIDFLEEKTHLQGMVPWAHKAEVETTVTEVTDVIV